MSKFQDFIEQDPARMARMNMFTQAAQQMARGGMVNMQTGGFVPFGNLNTFTQNAAQNQVALDTLNKQQQAQMEASCLRSHL